MFVAQVRALTARLRRAGSLVRAFALLEDAADHAPPPDLVGPPPARGGPLLARGGPPSALGGPPPALGGPPPALGGPPPALGGSPRALHLPTAISAPQT